MSLTPIEKAASGALASVIANTLVYPLDLSKTLIQTQVKPRATPMEKASSIDSVFEQTSDSTGELKYKHSVDVLKKIYAKKGILGWYHGLLSSLVGTAAQNFSYFYWYTIVKRVYGRIRGKTHKPTTLIELFLGALAAAISQMFTMPIGVITTQQQTDKDHKNWIELSKEVYDKDGLTGFWRGLRVSLVLCINPSITYGSYERLRQILYAAKSHLLPIESFSLGVISKSLATITTQPLIVSKAMLQKKDSDDPSHVKFDGFTHALEHLYHTESIKGLYKGITPQLIKGVFVQGLLFMFKDQIDLVFLLLLKILKGKK